LNRAAPFSLAFVADTLRRHGGHERAATEVMVRLAGSLELTIIASQCEIGLDRVRMLRVRGRPLRPAVLRTWAFARLSRLKERFAGCTITNSIGAAALDADVITAQFCHAAFTERFGGLRGGSGWRVWFQRAAQARFVAEERHAYRSRRLRRVIAVSRGIARELEEHYRVAPERIVVVPNGVDPVVFRPPARPEDKSLLRRELCLPQHDFLALFVGADWERKGLRDAIRAVAGVRDVHLVVLGHGNRAQFAAFAARLGVARRVSFLGVSETPERYYSACETLLFPSRYEGFALATLEAAASGLPIVAHTINGTEELVKNGENGWLVPRSTEALAEKLACLRDDSTLLRRLSCGARQSSLAYGWDAIAARQLAVFASAAGLNAFAPAPGAGWVSECPA
jgi:UDP-glucose:(heptosyl)LPS alpha-1,3-glucosyltransferase